LRLLQDVFSARAFAQREGICCAGRKGSGNMTAETKSEIMYAWQSYLSNRERRYKKNEGSTAQDEDYRKSFKEGVANHDSLSKKEKVELLSYMGMA
jgi:hypothetical protein